MGNIGSNLYKYIEKNKVKLFHLTGTFPIVKYISAKNPKKKRLIKFNKDQWINNPFDILKKDIDVLIELIGGSEGIAKKLVMKALSKKNM